VYECVTDDVCKNQTRSNREQGEYVFLSCSPFFQVVGPLPSLVNLPSSLPRVTLI
jgi:hypothetical protein